MNAPGSASARVAPLSETLFSVPSLRCAACIARLEGGLAQAPGIAAARVNFTAKRVTIAHDPDIAVPELIGAIGRLGFEAEPLGPAGETNDGESRTLLKAMAVAGFASMNIMLLSVSVWSGAEGATRDLFHWISALIALPTVAYAGRPFFNSAWAALRHGRTNMDVPISIGVAAGERAQPFRDDRRRTARLFRRRGHAALLPARRALARQRDARPRARRVDRAAEAAAPGALVLTEGRQHRMARTAEPAPNMRMIVAAGERLAADGVIEKGASSFDRALMTGESAPRARCAGRSVHAGTLNIDAPVTVRVTAAGPDTAIADIARMMETGGTVALSLPSASPIVRHGSMPRRSIRCRTAAFADGWWRAPAGTRRC